MKSVQLKTQLINAVISTARKKFHNMLLRTASVLALLAVSSPAIAADVTWEAAPGSNDFNTAGNWVGGGVPAGADTAFFSSSNTTTLDFSATTGLGGITLGAVAPAYALNINSGNIITLNGQGLGNAGALTISVENDQTRIVFRNSATADVATLIAQNKGNIQFDDQSTAGGASIKIMPANGFTGSVIFFDSSTADTANFDNNGQLGFVGTSTASSATIINDVLGSLYFNTMASAGVATITNLAGGETTFRHDSTAANSVVTTKNGGFTRFINNSSGGTSRQIMEAGGVLDISGLSLAAGGTTFGSIEGAGDILLGARKLTAGSLNTDTEFSGVITGNGAESLEKVGTGVLTLSGNSTYTGNTRIFGGTLIVNGTLVSNVQASGGSTLGGTGTVGLVEIKAGSFHAPGNSIGTQTINGNYGNSGTLQIEADDAGNSDKVIVNGTVNIAGATLEIQELPGTWGEAGDTFSYVIIDNDGNDAVTGSFGSVTNQLVFLAASVDYAGNTGNDIVLTLARNGVEFSDVAKTPNQKAVSAALQSGFDFGSDPALNGALLGLSAEGARRAFDLMSGEVHASAAHAMSSHAKTLTGAVGERLWSVGNGAQGASAGSQSFAMLGLNASSTELYNNRMALGASRTASQEFGAPMAAGIYEGVTDTEPQAPSLMQRFSMWVRGYGERSTLDGDGNAAELASRTRGVMGGGDVALTPALRLGILANWGTTDGDIAPRLSNFDMDTVSFAAYAGYSAGPLLFKGLIGYGNHDIDTNRTISFGGLNRTASADYDASQTMLYGEAAYRMEVGSFGIMPLAALRWSRTDIDGFSETGAGSLNLTARGRDEKRLESILGLRLATSLESNGLVWLPQARIGWTHAYGDRTPNTDLAFAGGGNFTIAGAPRSRDALNLGAGLNVTAGTGLTGFIDYSADLSKDGRDHAFSGGLRMEF